MAIDLKKLTADIIAANKIACEVAKNTNDGGTANLDCVFLRIPRIREEKVVEAIRAAGLYCRGKSQWRFMGNGYFLSPTVDGQGNRRSKGAETLKTKLQELGWDVCMFYQMD